MTDLALRRQVGTPACPQPSPEQVVDDPASATWMLVERARTGDTEAFGMIYDRYFDTVYRFAYFRVRNIHVAEDITADTFLRALKRIGSFTWQGRDLGAWLVRIARNLIADYFKSAQYRRSAATDHLSLVGAADKNEARVGWPGSDVASQVADHLTVVAVLDVMRKLKPAQQECIVLRFLQGFSVTETAQAMGKNEGAIKALQYRAVRTIHRLLPDGLDQQIQKGEKP